MNNDQWCDSASQQSAYIFIGSGVIRNNRRNHSSVGRYVEWKWLDTLWGNNDSKTNQRPEKIHTSKICSRFGPLVARSFARAECAGVVLRTNHLNDSERQRSATKSIRGTKNWEMWFQAWRYFIRITCSAQDLRECHKLRKLSKNNSIMLLSIAGRFRKKEKEIR